METLNRSVENFCKTLSLNKGSFWIIIMFGESGFSVWYMSLIVYWQAQGN